MNAARIAACAALFGIWATAAMAAGPITMPRAARPAKTSIIDLQRIDINNISMVVTNTGSFAYDKVTGNSGLEFPKGTGKTAVFAAGLWVGAEVAGNVRVAVAEYSDEYGAGAILPSGAPDDPDLPEYKIYKLNRTYDTTAERDAALADYEAGAETHGAPDVEVQSDGTLNILGDQMLWAVYNDADPANHSNRAGSTPPLGIEVQQTTFAFNRVGALGNTIFIRYIFINKGTNTLENMFVSQWSDPDLGGFTDDLVGSDVSRSLGFVYNATNADGQYGGTPPSVGYDFFKGPIAPGDSVPLPMASFNKYINGTDPDNEQKTYNYMKGLDADGNPIINPKTGQVTTFQVSGDPVTGTGWLDTSPDDRRLMLSSGPFTMAPGDTQEVVTAIIVAQGKNRLSSVTLLKCADDIAQSAFDQNFDLANPPSIPVTVATPEDGAVLLTWDHSAENYDEAPYEFEGYIVYQGASIAGPFVPVATFDVVNARTLVLDNECNEDLGVILPAVKASGTDSGLQYSIRITEDRVRGGPLYTGTQYYYRVTAYSVGEGSTPAFLESASPVIAVVPQTPAAGTDPSTAGLVNPPTYGQVTSGLPATTDSIQVVVVDPLQVLDASYRVGYKPGPDGIPVWYVVRTMGTAVDTVVNNQLNFSGDATNVVFDGISVRVFGAPYKQLLSADYIDVGPNPPGLVPDPDIGLTFFGGSADYADHAPHGSALHAEDIESFNNVEIRFTGGPAGQKAYQYVRSCTTPRAYNYTGYVDVPFTVWDIDNNRQLNVMFLENCTNGSVDGVWDPDDIPDFSGPGDDREFLSIFSSTYSPTPLPQYQVDLLSTTVGGAFLDFTFHLWALGSTVPLTIDAGDIFKFQLASRSENDFFTFTTRSPNRLNVALAKSEMERIKAVPNPYLTHSSYELTLFNRQVKFTHLPARCTIRIFSLRGDLLRVMEKDDTSSQLTWDLETSRGLPVASGIYIFHVDAPGIGTHVGKVAIFMEKERLNNF